MLSKALYKSWIYLWLLHLTFKKISQTLAFLNIKRKLSLVLLDLGKFERLLQVSKFSIALIYKLIYLLQLLFQGLDHASIRNCYRCSLLGQRCSKLLFVLNFTFLELREEVVHVLAAYTCRGMMEQLAHHSLNCVVLLLYNIMMVLHLSFKDLIFFHVLVELLFQINLIFIKTFFVGVF